MTQIALLTMTTDPLVEFDLLLTALLSSYGREWQNQRWGMLICTLFPCNIVEFVHQNVLNFDACLGLLSTFPSNLGGKGPIPDVIWLAAECARSPVDLSHNRGENKTEPPMSALVRLQL